LRNGGIYQPETARIKPPEKTVLPVPPDLRSFAQNSRDNAARDDPEGVET
jgi:hypothetical protein